MKIRVLYLLLCWLYFSCPFNAQDTLKVTYYNLLNFPYQQQDRIDTLKKILNYIQPDIFVVNELTSFNGGVLIKNNALNINGINDYASTVFYDGPDTDNLLFYDQTKLGLHSQHQIVTTLRDISEYVLYFKDPNLQLTLDTTYLYFYSLHLKAGNSSLNADRRNQDAVILKQYLLNNNRTNNLFVGGDFNFYDFSENGCQEILNGNGLMLYDPINRMGNWHTNSGYKNYHTQSTRLNNNGYAGGASGGMDDRFDFVFFSNDVMNGSNGVEYLSNSYLAEGQDGSYYNQALNFTSNSLVSSDVASALFYMSDHLPVSFEIILGNTLLSLSLKANELKINFDSYNDILKIKEISGLKQLKVYNLEGKCVIAKAVNNQTELNIDLSILKSGFYVLNCVFRNTVHNQKFIIN